MAKVKIWTLSLPPFGEVIRKHNTHFIICRSPQLLTYFFAPSSKGDGKNTHTPENDRNNSRIERNISKPYPEWEPWPSNVKNLFHHIRSRNISWSAQHQRDLFEIGIENEPPNISLYFFSSSNSIIHERCLKFEFAWRLNIFRRSSSLLNYFRI